jgi:hypothetical protein
VVNEVDSSGNFVSSVGSYNSLAGQNSFTVSGVNSGVFDIASLSSTLTGNGTAGGLTSAFTLTIDPNYNQVAGGGLQFVITGTGAANSFAGQPATFINQASATSGLYGTIGGTSVNIAGIAEVQSTTTVLGSSSPVSIADSQGSASNGPITNGNVANLPNPYSIIQTITVFALPVSGSDVLISSGAPFQGGASSTVTANSAPAAVPAPGGLVLALIALPLLGLRRNLRRKPAEALAI